MTEAHVFTVGPRGVPGTPGAPGDHIVLTRQMLEEILYDTVYSWELQPGSDVMATCVGVLPKVGVYPGEEADVYMGLVTWDGTGQADLSISGGENEDFFQLVPVGTPLTPEGYQNSSGSTGITEPGCYVAVFYSPSKTPPYAFPPGWTPGNTTGEGPVLPLIDTTGGETHYAGLVTVEAGIVPGDGSYPFWLLSKADTPLTADAMGAEASTPSVAGYGQDHPAGTYLAIYGVEEGDPAPTALPDGWTFRPYGIGQVAITDENAGGLIGDVAYVVSGYVFNKQHPAGMVKPGWRGILAFGEHTLAVDDYFQIVGDANLYHVTDAGTITINGVNDITDGTGSASTANESTYDYWPFIERYDLAQKKWLPRIPLPTFEFATTPEQIAAVANRVDPDGGWRLILPTSRNFNSATFTMPTEFPQLPKVGTRDVYLVQGDSIAAQYSDSGYWYASSISVTDDTSIHADGEVFQSFKFVIDGDSAPTQEELLAWWATVKPLLPSEMVDEMLHPSHGAVTEHADAIIETVFYASEGGIAGVIDGKLYFGGGDGDNITGNEFFVYDPTDDSITRLADFPDENFPDYSPYGVVDGSLWYIYTNTGQAWAYTPGSDEWVEHAWTGDTLAVNDQVQGFGIDGKLWFVYDGAAFVFDPDELTVTAKATHAPLEPGGASFLIDGKIHVFLGNGHDVSAVYDPEADTWTPRTDVAVQTFTNYSAEYAGLVHESVPYLLSAIADPRLGSGNHLGVYGMTGVTVDSPRSARLQDAKDTADGVALMATVIEDLTFNLVVGRHELSFSTPLPRPGEVLCRAGSMLTEVNSAEPLVVTQVVLTTPGPPYGIQVQWMITFTRMSDGDYATFTDDGGIVLPANGASSISPANGGIWNPVNNSSGAYAGIVNSGGFYSTEGGEYFVSAVMQLLKTP